MTDLGQEELAMVAELKLAHEEIRDLHIDEGGVPKSVNLKRFGSLHLLKTKVGSAKVLINGRCWMQDFILA